MNPFKKIGLLQRGTGAAAGTEPPAATPGGERRVRPRRNAPPGTRMLVVDDSRTILAVLRKMLRSANYEILEAENAEVGIELARIKKPDVVFLDIILPGMNGFAALRSLHRDPLTRHIPVILMTGNVDVESQFLANSVGASDVMKKPFSRREVFERIGKLIGSGNTP